MARNPKGSRWYATSQADRIRKKVCLVLSDAARLALEEQARARGLSRSRYLEWLLSGKTD